MSSLYKRGNIYWLSYWDKNLHKPRSISTGKKNQKEAEKFKKEFNAKLLLGINNKNLIRPVGYNHKFSEALTFFLNESNLASKTKTAYNTAALHFIKCCGDLNLYNYNVTHYREFINYLNNLTSYYKNSQKKLAYNSIANYVRHIHRLFNWFLKRKLVTENIIVEKVQPVATEVKIIPEEHLQQILENLKSRDLIKQYNFVRLTYLGALRISETISLRKTHIDMVNNILYVPIGKGKRYDGIPLVSDLREHILQMNITEENIFNYKSYDGVKTFWKTVNKLLGFNYNFHQLRKARGTHLAEKGVNPTFLQKFMRHKDFNTTIKYYIRVDLAKMKYDIDSKL